MSLQQKLNLGSDPVYLMDGTAFIYRGFYTNQNMSRSDGFPTNAVFLLARLLLRILREEKPRNFIFFMDGPGKNFRHEIFPDYKANRDATPENLIRQLDPIKHMVKTLGLCLEISRGCEADDCIASMCARLSDSMPVIIISGDKDLRQCLRPGVFMWDPALKEEKLLNAQIFKEETGVLPTQWPDVQALIGDSSDNIPGVPGIGIKTAEKIFRQFSSLEEITANVEQLAPSVRKKIEPHLENIFTYRKLTTLSTECCRHIKLDSIKTSPIDLDGIIKFFREFELNSLVREIESLCRQGGIAAADKSATKEDNKGSKQLSLFNLPEISEKNKPGTIDKQEFPAELPSYDGLPAAVLKKDELIHIASQNTIFIYGGPVEELANLLAGCVRLAAPNVKELFSDSHAWNKIPYAKWFDLGLADYLLNPEESEHSLARLLARAGIACSPEEDEPAPLALKAAEKLALRLENTKLSELYFGIEMPLIQVLAEMEKNGLRVDLLAFSAFLEEVKKDIDRVTEEVFQEAGKEFNMRSARQLGEILFETLELPTAGKTRGGQLSTSHEALEKLAGKHAVVDLMLEYRKLEKLRSTYLEPLPRLVDKNGRIHTTFNQTATATGRLSSSNPNLQNIPVRGSMGQRMRACFIAADGHLLVSADYSQVELRVLAHISKEPTLLDAFKEGADIHARTAGLLFNRSLEEISADQRRMAKTINFGLIYGMGPQKLARELSISTNEAKDFIAEYFKHMVRLKAFYDEVEEKARTEGFVATLAGRKRFLPDIHSQNQQARSTARRQAINTVIQGSAADIIKLAMLAVYHDERIRELNGRLLLQIHDELLLEAPEENAAATGARLAELMSAVSPGGTEMDIPLAVDWGIGKNWDEAH